MKNLFTAADNAEIIERISRLSPDTQALWGKMRVEQMLAHAQAPLHVALGEKEFKRNKLLSFLFGKIARKQLVKDEPFKKNLPTAPGFVVKDERKFEEEKSRLIDLVQRFGKTDPEEIAKRPHPFFGKLTPHEWKYASNKAS